MKWLQSVRAMKRESLVAEMLMLSGRSGVSILRDPRDMHILHFYAYKYEALKASTCVDFGDDTFGLISSIFHCARRKYCGKNYIAKFYNMDSTGITVCCNC